MKWALWKLSQRGWYCQIQYLTIKWKLGRLCTVKHLCCSKRWWVVGLLFQRYLHFFSFKPLCVSSHFLCNSMSFHHIIETGIWQFFSQSTCLLCARLGVWSIQGPRCMEQPMCGWFTSEGSRWDYSLFRLSFHQPKQGFVCSGCTWASRIYSQVPSLLRLQDISHF